MPQVPLYLEISAFKEPIQVVEANYKDWRSLRHYQNLAENGALNERFVSACVYQILMALQHVHKLGIVHCNLDLDHIKVYLTPFGGDHFKLVDFDNSRLAGSSVHPIFQNDTAKK